MNKKDVSVLSMESSYGKFKITVGCITSKSNGRTRRKDFANISVRSNPSAEQGMPYVPFSHINLYDNGTITSDWKENKKRREKSVRPFEQQLFDMGYSSVEGYSPADIALMVSAANSLLTSLRNHPRYRLKL
jgi:hypothetical protein